MDLEGPQMFYAATGLTGTGDVAQARFGIVDTLLHSPRQWTKEVHLHGNLERDPEKTHVFGCAMEPWRHFCLMRRTHDYMHPPATAHTVLWIWRHRRCLLLFQVSRCSSWSSSDRMRVVIHPATSELIWANPGGGRFEPSAGRQPLMKSIKLSTFREHCFTKPLKHTMQQTAELGLSACVESERAMLLFRGLRTTLQSRALIFFILFLAIIQKYLKWTSASLFPSE